MLRSEQFISSLCCLNHSFMQCFRCWKVLGASMNSVSVSKCLEICHNFSRFLYPWMEERLPLWCSCLQTSSSSLNGVCDNITWSAAENLKPAFSWKPLQLNVEFSKNSFDFRSSWSFFPLKTTVDFEFSEPDQGPGQSLVLFPGYGQIFSHLEVSKRSCLTKK